MNAGFRLQTATNKICSEIFKQYKGAQSGVIDIDKIHLHKFGHYLLKCSETAVEAKHIFNLFYATT